MADGAGGSGSGQLLEQRASQQSVELDIIQLSQQWEAQRTIRNGDTPGQALRKGPRPALASISANVAAAAAAAAAAANPFSFTAQRQKAAGGRTCPQPCNRPQHQQQQQPSVRFAADAPLSSSRRQGGVPAAVGGSSENLLPAAAAVAAAAAVEAATPAVAPPTTLQGRAAATCGGGGASVGGSPSPYVLFRGRLSFAAGEPDSARKFDRPTTARKPAAGAGLKRKLLISPGADISAAFPSLLKPSAKQRRRSLSDVGPSWSARAAQAEEECTTAAAAGAAAGGMATGDVEASRQGIYWSDPLPMPHSPGRGCAAAARAAAGAQPFAAAAGADARMGDDEMQDTAASPASSSGGGPCSPVGVGMDACCCSASPAPFFSPLPGAQQHALPTVLNPDCGFPAITARTMRNLLMHGAAAYGLHDFVVVDCRYDYEYAGGHLPGAAHLTTPEELGEFLAVPRPSSSPDDYWQRTAIIFHCEFSTERGPRAAKHVRNKDREAHVHDYPALSHPHVFVLQGGYKAFWKSFSELCEGGYTPMDHPDFSQQLKACHNVVKRAWAKTTRTYSRKQRQRRPSYRLRQSTSVGPGCEREGVEAAAADAVTQETAALPPAVVAAQHMQHT